MASGFDDPTIGFIFAKSKELLGRKATFDIGPLQDVVTTTNDDGSVNFNATFPVTFETTDLDAAIAEEQRTLDDYEKRLQAIINEK